MVDDRNLTVHYDESLARALFLRLPEYARLMEQVLGRLQR